MMITYRIPSGTQPVALERIVLTTPQGGKIAIDDTMLHIWEYADGRSLGEIVQHFSAPGLDVLSIRAAVGCLAEAGLLQRQPESTPAPALAPVQGPLVSVVIVGYQGRDWLEECIPSLLAQNYQPLEILVVDNASPEPLGPWLQTAFPQVKVLRLDQPHSFSAANNLGIQNTQGEYLFLLNQDTLLAPDAVAEMVDVFERSQKCACVAPKLRFTWAPAFLNGIGNRVQMWDWGTDNAIGNLDLGQFDHWKTVPSACFAAALVSRSAIQDVGPMDEGFPWYYEDVEWCYRARMLGYTIQVASRAVVYHALTGRVPSGKPQPIGEDKLRNVVYGRYRFTSVLMHELRETLLRRYLQMDTARFFNSLRRGNWAHARAYFGARLRFWRDQKAMERTRTQLAARRQGTDEALFANHDSYPGPALWNDLPDLSIHQVKGNYLPLMLAEQSRAVPEMTQSLQAGRGRPRLLIVSNDVVNEKMGGPGARYVEIAKALRGSIDVTLAVPNETSLVLEDIPVVTYAKERPSSLDILVENHDIALISGYMGVDFPFLRTTPTRLVVDLYDPFFLENMFYFFDKPMPEQQMLNRLAVDATAVLLQIGDFFICGTERQRDFWLGMLSGLYRITPPSFSRDTTLRSLIDVVGIGYPTRSLEPRPVVRGTLVSQDAPLVVWGGGIWNWLDPLTLVNAWPAVLAAHPSARLVFLGTRYPNPIVPEHRIARETIALAERLGEKDRSIFFIEWLPYDEHQALLREADLGVSLQPEHVESRFAIRTRVIDYFAAGLPSVVSTGDMTAGLVEQYDVGRVIPAGDAETLGCVMAEMLRVPKSSYQARFERLRGQFQWDSIVAPLRAYCLSGTYAQDRGRERYSIPVLVPLTPNIQLKPPSKVQKAVAILRERGVVALIRQTLRHIKWLVLHK